MKVSLRASLRAPTMARLKHELGGEFTTVFHLESYRCKVRPSVCSSSLSLVLNPGPHRAVVLISTLSASVTKMEEVEDELLFHLFTSEELH